MTEKIRNFISIPGNSFTIFVGSRLFLIESLEDIPRRFSHQKVLYLYYGQGMRYLHPSDEERTWVEFREVESIVDIFAMLESDPARFMVIEYNPEWFREDPEYLYPFGHLCRERSIKRQEVFLISRVLDNIISELETMADKMAVVQDILESPNKKKCDISQETLEFSDTEEQVERAPVRRYGQQVLGFS